MNRDAMLNVRVSSDMKKALQQAAADDHDRSVSAMVTIILADWLADRGYLRRAKKKGER